MNVHQLFNKCSHILTNSGFLILASNQNSLIQIKMFSFSLFNSMKKLIWGWDYFSNFAFYIKKC